MKFEGSEGSLNRPPTSEVDAAMKSILRLMSAKHADGPEINSTKEELMGKLIPPELKTELEGKGIHISAVIGHSQMEIAFRIPRELVPADGQDIDVVIRGERDYPSYMEVRRGDRSSEGRYPLPSTFEEVGA